MLKTEGVYDEYCYSEAAAALNHTYLSSVNRLDGHLNDRNASLISAKLNATLTSLPDYTTELPSFNITNNDDYFEPTEEDEPKNNSNRDAEEARTTTDRPGDGEAKNENVDRGENENVDRKENENREENEKEEKVSDNANREEDEPTTTESSDGSDNMESDDPSGANGESINRITNVPSIITSLPASVRRKRDENNERDSDPGKNGPTSQVTFFSVFV